MTSGVNDLTKHIKDLINQIRFPGQKRFSIKLVRSFQVEYI